METAVYMVILKSYFTREARIYNYKFGDFLMFWQNFLFTKTEMMRDYYL